MKPFAVALGLVASAAAFCQVPTVQLHLDLTGSLRIQQTSTSLFQFYDVMGRPSIVSLSFFTQQGFRVYAAEKLQPLPGDSSNDPFDEYYVEDEGIWRVGKQYLPFGSGHMLHESALAVRGDTSLILENVPIAIAFCNGGNGYESGFTGRIGSVIGASLAWGRHFGIAATSFDDIRKPEDAPGQSRGWKEAFGLDASRRLQHWTVRAEAISLQGAETPADFNRYVFDVSAALNPVKGETTTFGWSRQTPDRHDFYRIQGAYEIVKHVTFEPMIRFRDGTLFDLTAQVRIKF